MICFSAFSNMPAIASREEYASNVSFAAEWPIMIIEMFHFIAMLSILNTAINRRMAGSAIDH